jgi:acyl carrier protein
VLQVDRKAIQNHEVVSLAEKNGRTRALVGCGPVCQGLTVEIVDPQSLAVCGTNEIGEIWVRGDSIARGYWNKEQATAETFHAEIAANGSGQVHAGEYLRTGDLGFRHEGELFVTGRLKDVIIVRGRNHYPQDLERTAETSHEAVDMGAAFSVEVDGNEELVLVHQWRRECRHTDHNEMIHAIRTAIVAEHEIDPHAILLIRPASLPITSSGKVQRQRCREQYLNGELAVTAEWVNKQSAGDDFDGLQEQLQGPPEFLQRLGQLSPEQLQAEVQSWLVAWLGVRANLPPGVVQPTAPFAQLGIDSLTAVEISQELDQILGLQSPPMVIWTCPTPAELANYLTEELQSAATKIG